MAQGTAQIAAADATAKQAAPSASPTVASLPTEIATLDSNVITAAAAPSGTGNLAPVASTSLGSLFAADGHAFDNAAAAPHSPIAVTGIDITVPFLLRSADDLATPYTNYTSGYKALLDYVWWVWVGMKSGGLEGYRGQNRCRTHQSLYN